MEIRTGYSSEMWLFGGILHECKAADTTTLWRLKYPREVSRNMHDPQEDKLSKELELGPIRGDISSAKDVLLLISQSHSTRLIAGKSNGSHSAMMG